MCRGRRVRYVSDSEHAAQTLESLIIQLCFCKEGSEILITAKNISGQELCSLQVNCSDNAGNLQQALGNLLGVSSSNIRAVLPDGQILGSIDRSMHVSAIISADLNANTE